MTAFLSGYYALGLRALDAARLGLQVAGNNIANASTPGYSRRRLETVSGLPLKVQGGFLDSGVVVSRIGRPTDRFLQTSLERERGSLTGSQEQLRGLREIESVFGSLQGVGLQSAYAAFSDAFTQLAGQPESLSLRREAVSSADALARLVRDTYSRLRRQQQAENDSVAGAVGQINDLAASLAGLNREIAVLEADGSIASPLRDRREQIVSQLSELTGGYAYQGDGGKTQFALPGGPTLVTGDNAIPLSTARDGDGLLRIRSISVDYTDRVRSGKLGALLELRDEQIPQSLQALDDLAADLITRANILTNGATDLDGNPGRPLFDPASPRRLGAAQGIFVAADVLADPTLLAVSSDGTPGNGAVADRIADLFETESFALGNASPSAFLTDLLAGVGTDIVQADVATNVSEELLQSLRARRDAISGVSLDEEAVELVRHQQAYEAAARFMQVLNEVTEITLSIGSR